jgi:hypothetical protein
MKSILFLFLILSLTSCASMSGPHIQKKCKPVQGMDDTFVCEHDRSQGPF